MVNFISVLKVIFPVFALMLIGYILKSASIINENTVRQINKMIFWVTLPLFVFSNIYASGISSILPSTMLIFILSAVVGEFLISLFLVMAFEKNNSKRAVMLQAVSSSQFALLGIPILTAVTGITPAIVSVMILCLVPLLNLLSVVSLEVYRGNRPNLFNVLKGIFTNPMILFSILAIALLYFHVQIPSYIVSAVENAGNLSTPLAFIMLGAYFSFSDTASYFKQIALTILLKILLFPTIILAVAIFMGLRGADLILILCIFIAPCAVHSFAMAQELNGDERLANQLVVLTFFLSIGAAFLFSFILKQMGMI
ncbi:AEC family transporter [Scatolibacter rhodanostii]|uniref:AEC family transporter n=1 Tax=Scatolibacter rhodanostii TaxID=2014781 RepID=UPI000C069D89|nr:AEC family transporter [Scatolibacter rhodanostii]